MSCLCAIHTPAAKSTPERTHGHLLSYRVDVGPLLPAALPHDDAAELLQLCPAVQRALNAKPAGKADISSGGGGVAHGAFASGTCLASGQLLAELSEQLGGEARAAAERQLKEQAQRKAVAASPQLSGKADCEAVPVRQLPTAVKLCNHPAQHSTRSEPRVSWPGLHEL